MTRASTAGSLSDQLQELTGEECLRLLRSKHVGRVAYNDAEPVVLPVNYVIDSDTVLFCTSPYSSLGQNMRRSQTAFEVDEIDDETGAGWSVLVRGLASYVRSTDLPEAAARPTPWRERGGAQSLHVRITPRLMSGRRLERGSAARPWGDIT
jgi:nitroimidazol reductase NimA-like FMN-containing flavoprotein (pyridoxamine 5'-phosphate oxidase superfamily)